MSSKASIASVLTDQLRSAILWGSFAPDSRLRLEELGAAYGVSLSPVREALLRLCGEGIVVSKDQRGFRVAEASLRNLQEVVALRGVLEPYALGCSIERGARDWEETLVATFHRLTRIEQKDGFVPMIDEWERAHRDFHLCLVGGCEMPMLQQICAQLHDQADRYRRLYLKRMPPQRNVAGEHAQIVEAVLARDRDRACDLLLRHTRSTGELVHKFMSAAASGSSQESK